MRIVLTLVAGALLAACVPNPRNEIPAIIAAAMAATASTPLNPVVCVEREVRRFPSEKDGFVTPRGFEELTGSRFRGGGGIKGPSVAGVTIRHDQACVQLYGPIVAGDRAAVRAVGRNSRSDIWLRRTGTRWNVERVSTTP